MIGKEGIARVFSSYSSTDSIFVELLKVDVHDMGMGLWLDSGESRAGEEWRNSVDKRIFSMDVRQGGELMWLQPRTDILC